MSTFSVLFQYRLNEMLWIWIKWSNWENLNWSYYFKIISLKRAKPRPLTHICKLLMLLFFSHALFMAHCWKKIKEDACFLGTPLWKSMPLKQTHHLWDLHAPSLTFLSFSFPFHSGLGSWCSVRLPGIFGWHRVGWRNSFKAHSGQKHMGPIGIAIGD